MDFRRRETLLAPTRNRSPHRPFPCLVAIRTTIRRLSLMTSKKYSLKSIIRVIKSIKISSAGLVARVGIGEVQKGFLWGDVTEGDHLEDVGIDGRIILKWILKRCLARVWIGLTWLRIWTGGGLL